MSVSLLLQVVTVFLYMGTAIADNEHMVTYIVRDSNISEIPPDVPLQTTYLDLSSNEIESVTSLGEYSVNLIYLSLENNPIEHITPGVFNMCHSLQTLILADNLIHILQSDTFRGLGALRSLTLGGDTLEVISHKAFRGLVNLTHL